MRRPLLNSNLYNILSNNCTANRLILRLCLTLSLFLIPSTLYADITVAGSSTIQPVIMDTLKIFHNQTGIRLYVKGGGSGTGIRGALDGTIDVGMVSRALNEGEAEEGLVAHPIGYDGIAVIINSAISLEAISRAQLYNIYAGTQRNWRFVGAGEHEITVIAKREGRSTRQLFDAYCGLKEITPSAHLAGPNEAAIVLVGSDSSAIGYVSIGVAEEAVELGVSIRFLTLDGIKPSQDNVVNGSYPIRRQLNLVTKGQPSTEVQRFIRFMQSDAGQAILQQHHFITLNSQLVTP